MEVRVLFDLSVFPITAGTVRTVAGSAVLCVLFTQLIKVQLPDWRWTNLLAWGITFTVVQIAGVWFAVELTLAERIYNGFLVSVGGVSLATFGYETLMNLLGLAGVGPRSQAGSLSHKGGRHVS